MIGILLLQQRPDNVQALLDSLRSTQPVSPTGPPAPVVAPVPVPVVGGRADAVGWVYANASNYGLDPAAVLAVAEQEGLGGGIGDGGLAYGPWQDHLTQFVGRPWFGYGRNNADVQAWAWSDAGFDYVMRQMVSVGASGLTGRAAIAAIVQGYERSADQPGEIARAAANYSKWARQA